MSSKISTFVLALGLLVLPVLAAPVLGADEPAPPPELPPLGEQPPVPVPEVVRVELSNGLEIWVLERPGPPRMTARLVALGGTAYDPPELRGLAELLADAYAAGTAELPAEALAEELQALGGELSTEAGRDELLLTVTGFSTHAGRLLEILADVVRRPAFPADEVALARDRALQGLSAREARPDHAVDKAFAAAAFPEHPYRTVAPERAALEAATPELLRHEARRVRPERSLLLVVGAVDGDEIVRRARELFGDWRVEAPAPPKPSAAPETAESQLLLIDRPGAAQTEIRGGRPIPPRASPDYAALVVTDVILGGGFDSRLWHNLREDKGYTYSPAAAIRTYTRGGLLWIFVATRAEVAGPALLELRYELDRLALLPVSEAELESAQRFLRGYYLLDLQVQGRLVRALTWSWFKGLEPRSLSDYMAEVEAVTVADVERIARQYFRSAGQIWVVGGDAEALRPQLEILGPVRVVEP